MFLKLEPYIKIQSLIVTHLYLGQILIGFAFGWSAVAISKIKSLEESPIDEVIDDQQGSWMVSAYYIGGVTGPYAVIFLSNMIGRKPCLILGGFTTFVSFIILSFVKTMTLIYIGRFIGGLGVGTLIVTQLVYIGEITSTPIRGVLLTITGIFTNSGILLNYTVAPYFSYNNINYLGLVISFLYTSGLLLIPETPLFLILKGKLKEAKIVLELLKREADFDDVLAFKEMEANSNKWTEILSVKSNRKAFFITVILHILQEFSGILIILNFVTTIFGLVNSSMSAYMSTLFVGITQILAGSIAPTFVERSGRKILLLCSSGFCSVSMALLGTYFYLDYINSPVSTTVSWLPLASVITFTMSYALGYGIIPATFIGEMFTPNTRSTGATLSITIGLLWGIMLTLVYGYLPYGPHVAFWIFAVGCAVTFIFTLLFVPETKGKSLLEVQEILSR